MKEMAALFTAFDHPIYQKLLSQHLVDVLHLPNSVKAMFEQGAFVVSIKGQPWSSIGIDEAHEMLINKACKTSIVRPTKDYINRVAHYIPYRTKTLENLKHQLFPTAKHSLPTTTSAYSSDPSNLKSEKNIQAQIFNHTYCLLLEKEIGG